MADHDEKQATCPICGYTDTAGDADTLKMAIEDHMRQAHNMAAPVNADNADIKPTGRDYDVAGVDDDRIPAPGVGGNVVAPGNNVGNNVAR